MKQNMLFSGQHFQTQDLEFQTMENEDTVLQNVFVHAPHVIRPGEVYSHCPSTDRFTITTLEPTVLWSKNRRLNASLSGEIHHVFR